MSLKDWWIAKLNKKSKNRNKLYLSIKTRTDIFGNIIRLQKINKSFTFVYLVLYKKVIASENNNVFLSLKKKKKKKQRNKVQTQIIRGTGQGSIKLRQVIFFKKRAIHAFYSNIKKKQLKDIFIKACKMRGDLVSNFLTKLETRLDMFLYRAFNLLTMPQIKQLISHKKVYVNGKIIRFHSYTLSKFDIISFFDYTLYGYNKMNVYNVYLNIQKKSLKYSVVSKILGINAYISIYKHLLVKLNRKDRKYLICKHPKYIEVFYPLLIATLVEDKLFFKDVPYFFSINQNIFLNLFR